MSAADAPKRGTAAARGSFPPKSPTCPLRAMPSYSLYYMNPVSGHIDRRETLHAGDDVAAVHTLQGLQPDGAVELWRGGKKNSRQDGPPSPFRNRVLAPALEPTPEPGGEQVGPGWPPTSG